MNRHQVERHLKALPDIRAPLPMAYGDPAFIKCLEEAFCTPEMVDSFNRLYGGTLMARSSQIERMIDQATGKDADDFRAFGKFVHGCIYLRLPNEAIHALRLSSEPFNE